MRNEQFYIKFLGNLTETLLQVALFCLCNKNLIVSPSWTSDYEFCETRWFEFLNEKQKWDKSCGNNTAINMSACCKKENLLYRFKRYSEICLLEGKPFLILLSTKFYKMYLFLDLSSLFLINDIHKGS
jgi:hypothetical protein